METESRVTEMKSLRLIVVAAELARLPTLRKSQNSEKRPPMAEQTRAQFETPLPRTVNTYRLRLH